MAFILLEPQKGTQQPPLAEEKEK